MNSKRHSRLRRHQAKANRYKRRYCKLRRRIADAVAGELVKALTPRLLQMFSGEMRGGVVSPGTLKFDRAKFITNGGASMVTGPKPYVVNIDELHEIERGH